MKKIYLTGLLVVTLIVTSASSLAANMNYIGTWLSTTSYFVGNVVTLNKQTYYALLANKNINPVTGTNAATNWQAIGTVGNTVTNGVGAPTLTVGNAGDFYIDTTNKRLYGPKTTSWPTVFVSMVGIQGTQGIQGLVGAQGPVGATGATGVAGPVGATGATGPVGASGTTIANGTNTGDTLMWNGTAWTPVTKTSTGFVLLDANGAVIGEYDFLLSGVILEKNSIYYYLPVTSSGFTETQNIFASNPQFSTYFTTADCTGTAYYEAIDYSSLWASQTFSNRVTSPIVYGNALYKQDPTQVYSILAMSRMVGPGPANNNNCFTSGVPLNGGTWGNGSGVPMNVVTPNSMILIEDLSIYPTPFSIKAD